MKRRILALIVLLAFAAGMVSCTKTENGETRTNASQAEEGNGSVFYYREEKSAYEKESPRVEPEGDYGELRDYCEAADGDIYYLYEEEIKEQVENSYCMYEIDQANRDAKRIPHILRYCSKEASFEEIELSTDPDLILWRLDVSEDGTLLVFGSGYRAYVYPPGEKESRTDFPADPYAGYFFKDATHLVCQPAAGSDYMVFDIMSGEKAETYVSREFLYEGVTNGGTFLAEHEGNQLLVTGNGIYEKEGEEWNLKVPSDGTSMGLGGFSPSAVWKEGEDYCLVAFERGPDMRFTYRYSLTERTGETIELTVFSAAENSFLKKAALEYQLSHPEVVITYTFAENETPQTMQEMDILLKRVNTEIISDKAADIYMLDWLPWEGYAEKGYLLDLDEALQPLLGSGEYFDGVLSGCRREEGTFAMPLFFQADMVMGRNEVMPYAGSLADFAGYLEENPGAPGLVPYYYRDNLTDMFLPMLYSFYGEELYEEGRITEESLAAFLTGAKTLYDRLMSDDATQKPPYQMWYEGYHKAKGLWLALYQLMGLESGSMDLVPVRNDAVSWLPQVFHYEDYSLCATGRFHPSLLMGIHSRTAHPKEAEDFLQFLAQYTGNYTNWSYRAPGIAVNRSAVALWMDTITTMYRERFGWNIEFFYADEDENWPRYLPDAEKDAERMEAILSEADTPAAGDANALTDPVYAVLLEETPGFFAGRKTLEETVDALYGRLTIVQSERE